MLQKLVLFLCIPISYLFTFNHLSNVVNSFVRLKRLLFAHDTCLLFGKQMRRKPLRRLYTWSIHVPCQNHCSNRAAVH